MRHFIRGEDHARSNRVAPTSIIICMKKEQFIELILSNKENFIESVAKATCLKDLTSKYQLPDNGIGNACIKHMIKELDLTTDHFDLKFKARKYQTAIKTCPCGKEFVTKIGNKKEQKTCSVGCGNKYLKIRSKETNDKIKASLQKRFLKTKTCKECGSLIGNKQIFCSRSCARKNRTKNPEYRKLLSEKAKERVKNGTHKGWISRKVISYPEKFFMKVLQNNKISYEHNFPAYTYFIDFAILDKKVALEIDGKQHLLPERLESDQKKDSTLKEMGWKIYRIPWNSINSKEGKILMQNKISDFISFLNSLEPIN